MLSKHPLSLLRSLPVSLLALILFLQFSVVLFSGFSAQAESRYIKPSSEAAVRRGQGTEYKIVAMVKDGTLVEFVEEDEDYARILLSNGKEGWILKRFLSIEPPLNELVASLRSQKDEMLQREIETNQQLETVSAILAQTEQERNVASNERDHILTSYTNLKEDTADIVQIKEDMQKTSQENETLHQKVILLEQANETLQKDNAFKWFLIGGGVLLLGMLIGKISGGSRRKKPSLLS